MLVVKKYANRRLYDTAASRYITLEDLADRIRRGTDTVSVQDAHSGVDITQATLTQIILESRGGAKLLPVPLLLRLIRMEDESLAEFFGRYVSWALETYLNAKQTARTLLPINPLATAPFAATDALARLVLGASPFRGKAQEPAPPAAEAPPPMPMEEPEFVAGHPATVAEDVARLRSEIDALKRSLGKPARARPAKRKRR
ncbi:MAG TPA: polyhydroxyalkanoate synthesis regulator DNA-binding domain-containing protein [Labilithrix sp.]